MLYRLVRRNTHTCTCNGTQVQGHVHLFSETQWQIKVRCNTPCHTYSSCSDGTVTWWVMHPKLYVLSFETYAHIYTHSHIKQQHGGTHTMSSFLVCVFAPMCACNRKWGYVFIPVTLYFFLPSSLLPPSHLCSLCLSTFDTSTPLLFQHSSSPSSPHQPLLSLSPSPLPLQKVRDMRTSRESHDSFP